MVSGLGTVAICLAICLAETTPMCGAQENYGSFTLFEQFETVCMAVYTATLLCSADTCFARFGLGCFAQFEMRCLAHESCVASLLRGGSAHGPRSSKTNGLLKSLKPPKHW